MVTSSDPIRTAVRTTTSSNLETCANAPCLICEHCDPNYRPCYPPWYWKTYISTLHGGETRYKKKRGAEVSSVAFGSIWATRTNPLVVCTTACNSAIEPLYSTSWISQNIPLLLQRVPGLTGCTKIPQRNPKQIAADFLCRFPTPNQMDN